MSTCLHVYMLLVLFLFPLLRETLPACPKKNDRLRGGLLPARSLRENVSCFDVPPFFFCARFVSFAGRDGDDGGRS